MKIKNLALSFALSAFSLFSNAQDITIGTVIEGVSIPIGVAIGDSRQDVESVLNTYSEFDINDTNKTNCPSVISCVYSAIDDAGQKVGSITVRYSSDADTVTEVVWTFEKWITTAGISLENINDFDESELKAFYPSADRARIFDTSRGKLVHLRVSDEGLVMVARPGRNFGSISAPR